MICRAKSLLTNEFVEGAFIQGRHAWIVQIYGDEQFRELLVDPKTVGRQSDMVDENRKRIFEGDIVRDHGGVIYSVVWRLDGFYLKYSPPHAHGMYTELLPLSNYWHAHGAIIEVIGNIHDNPELLQEVRHG